VSDNVEKRFEPNIYVHTVDMCYWLTWLCKCLLYLTL